MTPTITRTFTPIPAGTPLDTASQVVSPALPASVDTSGGATVSIPANTFTQPVTLSVYEYASGSAPVTNTAFQVSFMKDVFIIDAGGEEPQAGSSVTITLPYDPAGIPGGYTAADLALSYFDGTGWMTLPASVDAVNHTISVVVDHFSWWAVVMRVHTPTPTSTPYSSTKIPILFPNPSDGRPVNVLPPLTKSSDVKVQIFTVSFRKVNEFGFPHVQPGATVSIPLTDMGNKPLASGLYYVVVITDEGRSIAKLMIIR